MNQAKYTNRQIVPYTTRSGLQIGCAWTPRITVSDAQWLERHTSRSYGNWWWAALWSIAGLALVLIVGGA